MMCKFVLAAVAALSLQTASIANATSAHRPADCVLEVEGMRFIDGPATRTFSGPRILGT
jgi:hypothetical protein